MKNMRAMLDDRKGLTLLASMMILIVMSLLGVVAVNVAVRDTKIAKNYEDSRMTLVWAEAGIEIARKTIIESQNPEIPGFDCEPTNPASFHVYPDGVPIGQEKVLWCVELLDTTQEGNNEDQRGSGQDQAGRTIKRLYKIDSYVMRPDSRSWEEFDSKVILRHVQSLEQHSRSSI